MLLQFTGNVKLGRLRVSLNSATLSVNDESLTLAAFPLGNYHFKCNQVISLERVSFSGILIKHIVKHYPGNIVFMIGSPEKVIEQIEQTGFLPTATQPITWRRRGGAVRWQIEILLFIWVSGFALLTKHYSELTKIIPLPVIGFLGIFLGSLLLRFSETAQKIAIKPGRHVWEIIPILNFVIFHSGLFFIVTLTVWMRSLIIK